MKMKAKMKLQQNKKYKLTFYIFGKTLTFTGVILDVDDFVEFRDKFGEIIRYNKNCLISYEEVSND